MGFYVLTDGNGGYIRHDESSGKYVPIRSMRGAKQFDSRLKASTILNNAVSKNIRRNYNVQYFCTENEVNKDKLEQSVSAVEDESIEYDAAEWLSKITDIKNIALFSSEDRIDKLSKSISDIDKKINDIQHYIEFGTFNAYQGWVCFKTMQTFLKTRRKYKDEMSILLMIKKCEFNVDAIKSLEDSIRNLGDRHYKPRALPELFGS